MGGNLAQEMSAMTVYRDNPPVCLFVDSVEALERMARTAEEAGCRVASATLLQADVDELACIPTSTPLVELTSSAAEEPTVGLLNWIRERAEEGRPAVVSFPISLIDIVAARAWHPKIQWLCESSGIERASVVSSISRPADPRFQDISRDEGPLILQQLSEDVGRIAALLASLTDEDRVAIEGGKAGASEDKDAAGVEPGFVRGIIRARRLRDNYFRGGLFADPAWDMLLDLFAARLEGTRVAVSSLCIAAAVPATTALRWIKALTDRGIFVRSADPQDGRRVYIGLSDEAARALTAYLRAVQRSALTAI